MCEILRRGSYQLNCMFIFIWKRVDSFGNAVRLRFESNRNHSRWLTYSWILSLFGVTVRRADYVQFMARRYSENVRNSVERGYQPGRWEETQDRYWYQKLINAGF